MNKCLAILVVCVFGAISPYSYAMDAQFHESRGNAPQLKMETMKGSFRDQKADERVSKPKVFLSKVGDVSKTIWSNAGKICLYSFSSVLILKTLQITLSVMGLVSSIKKLFKVGGIAQNCCKCPDLKGFGIDAF